MGFIKGRLILVVEFYYGTTIKGFRLSIHRCSPLPLS
jgi:hypothetical protein